jgi:hypothetical protein
MLHRQLNLLITKNPDSFHSSVCLFGLLIEDSPSFVIVINEDDLEIEPKLEKVKEPVTVSVN